MSRVLIVDDEPLVLESLARSLRVHRRAWQVETASSGAQALERLARGGIDVVLCDLAMPGMSGEQVLSEVQRRWPEVVRVALSGRIDPEIAQRLTHHVHQLVPKPFEAQQLFELVDEALKARDLLVTPALRRLVGQLGELPAMPQTFGAIVSELQQPTPSLARVTTLVGKDPALSADVLKLVNSAWVGLSRKVGSLGEAVRLLGLKQTELVVLSAEVYGGEHSAALGTSLQRDVLARSRRVQRILEAAGVPELVPRAQTAAVLSDVGLMVLASRAPSLFSRVQAVQAAEGCEWHVAEGHVLGTHHGVLGGALLGLWHLPAELCQAVTLHHGPWTETPRQTPAAALGLAVAWEQLQNSEVPDARLRAEFDVLARAFPALDAERLLREPQEKIA